MSFSGYSNLIFKNTGNHFTWKKVTTLVNNIIVGKLWIDNVCIEFQFERMLIWTLLYYRLERWILSIIQQKMFVNWNIFNIVIFPKTFHIKLPVLSRTPIRKLDGFYLVMNKYLWEMSSSLFSRHMDGKDWRWPRWIALTSSYTFSSYGNA